MAKYVTKEQRKYFRYQFPRMPEVIATDEQDYPIEMIDISHGGLGFYSSREHPAGGTETVHLLNFKSLQVKIKFCAPTGNTDVPGRAYKVGAEFVEFILTPQNLIEYLEMHMMAPKE